jgi:hypothetical protein
MKHVNFLANVENFEFIVPLHGTFPKLGFRKEILKGELIGLLGLSFWIDHETRFVHKHAESGSGTTHMVHVFANNVQRSPLAPSKLEVHNKLVSVQTQSLGNVVGTYTGDTGEDNHD